MTGKSGPREEEMKTNPSVELAKALVGLADVCLPLFEEARKNGPSTFLRDALSQTRKNLESGEMSGFDQWSIVNGVTGNIKDDNKDDVFRWSDLGTEAGNAVFLLLTAVAGIASGDPQTAEVAHHGVEHAFNAVNRYRLAVDTNNRDADNNPYPDAEGPGAYL